jgi:hypothetical protein
VKDREREQLEAARHASVPVVPVLLDGGSMPSPSDLPASLEFFSKLQAHKVHEASWKDDVAALSRKLERM